MVKSLLVKDLKGNGGGGGIRIRLYTEFLITIDLVRGGDVKDINAKIANARQKMHRRHSNVAHVRNLIELGLDAEAAGLLGQEAVKTDRSIIERK